MTHGCIRINARNDKVHHVAFDLSILSKIPYEIFTGESCLNLKTSVINTVNEPSKSCSAIGKNEDKRTKLT